ncbi:transposase [uncultured Desulfovibrio sp.]|uniref:transposase n=1 Tax=uncultured Desulfovibrio sp. TaxID=167968 RepID=UPI00345DB667
MRDHRSIFEKKKTETRGRKRKDDSLMFNGILWILKTGTPWRDLPAELRPWNTVHKRFLEWTRLIFYVCCP